MRRLFSIFAFLPILSYSQDCNGRYDVAELFQKIDTIRYLYGENTDVRDSTIKLYLDVYKPSGDSVKNRPCVIFIHGGRFGSTTYIPGQLTSGNRKSFEISHIANYLAKRGHVVASIDYRLDFKDSLTNAKRGLQSIVRGVQDANAAIRFLKFKWDTLGLDSNRFFLGGISYGGVIALTFGFSQYFDFDSAQKTWIDELGGLQGFTNTINKDVDLLGLFSFSGAVLDTAHIDDFEYSAYLNHERWDPVINYYTGYTTFGNTGFQLYGSGDIKSRKDSVFGSCNLDTYNDVYHPSLAYIWRYDPSELSLNRYFWEKLRCDIVSIQSAIKNDIVSFYPNPANHFITLDAKRRMNSVEIFDILGKSWLNYKGPNKQIDISILPKGVYMLKVNEQFLRLMKDE